MVILSIIKWIGIVLGCLVGGILALALLILICVLFIPVRYRAMLVKDQPGIKNATYGFWITYALHAVSIRKKPDSDLIVVKILGIPIKKIGGGSGKEKELDDIFDEDIDSVKADASQEAQGESELTEATVSGRDDSEISDIIEDNEVSETESSDQAVNDDLPGDEQTAEDAVGEDGLKKQLSDDVTGVDGSETRPEDSDLSEDEQSANDVTGEDEATEKVPVKDRIKARVAAIKAIPDKIRGIFQKIDFIFFKISCIIDFVNDHATTMTIKKLIKEVVAAIRYVGPKKLKGSLEFGTGEPDSTGMILGGVSLMKVVYSKDVNIVPNFDEKCLIGDMEVRGRIRAVYFVRMALRIWFNKDVHRLWKRFRHMRKKIARHEK